METKEFREIRHQSLAEFRTEPNRERKLPWSQRKAPWEPEEQGASVSAKHQLPELQLFQTEVRAELEKH